ncbi:MAG: Bax inhibitor-1/YccA family protein [Candidatus Hadarchaeota archaeon]
MFRTGNPVLKDRAATWESAATSVDSMTINGTVNKTLLLLGILVAGAFVAWNIPLTTTAYIFSGAIVALIFGFVTIFMKSLAWITSPIYALAEGLALGGISKYFEMVYPGIVPQAVALTLGVLFCLLLIYKSGLIPVTANLALGVATAMMAIFLIYFLSFVLGLFGYRVPFIHESGAIGIAFSLFVIVMASLNLVLDFDFIEKWEDAGAPKHMEWYGAFGLMVSLVWLYMEILRLLAKMRKR